jgi:hypothetical protein
MPKKVYDSGVDIVLVHLNTKLPRYVKRNLVKLKDNFPNHNIVLISNTTQPRIKNIGFVVFEESEESRAIDLRLSHPKNFRNNFWHASIARFTYLLSYQQEIGKPILHVESDVILSKDFPMEIIAENSNLSFPVLSRFRGVASVFYSNSAESLSEFINFLVSESDFDSQITDMTALRRFYDRFPKRVEILPAGPSNKSAYEKEIENDIYSQLIQGLDKYGGVFDGSDIGMFLFGTDPRNALGYSMLRKEIDSTYTRMSDMEFRYNKSREFVDVMSNGQWIPVFNIHMTCKNSKFFLKRPAERDFKSHIENQKFREVFMLRIYLRMGLAKIFRIIRHFYK